MPIVIPNTLPAYSTLTNENIFVMGETRALNQDIRPIKIAIVNLMPTKIETETQLLRLIGNTPLQIEVTLINTATYQSKNIGKDHLGSFYTTFEKVKDQKFDGMIITGAPIETLDFEKVTYWKELTQIMEFSKTNVTSTFHICWGAQAGLYYHYGINKREVEKKIFGIFEHYTNEKKIRLLRGFDDTFYAPHSRYTESIPESIESNSNLEILARSKDAGIYLLMDKSGKHIFATGHSEYDIGTLDGEYRRDIEKGIDIDIPKNYYSNNDPNKKPIMKWRSHATLLFINWLNYYVYQETPYDFK